MTKKELEEIKQKYEIDLLIKDKNFEGILILLDKFTEDIKDFDSIDLTQDGSDVKGEMKARKEIYLKMQEFINYLSSSRNLNKAIKDFSWS